MMEYKGWLAVVEFDDSADILHGRVVNTGPYPMGIMYMSDQKERGKSISCSL